jgi:hypothetical protein
VWRRHGVLRRRVHLGGLHSLRPVADVCAGRELPHQHDHPEALRWARYVDAGVLVSSDPCCLQRHVDVRLRFLRRRDPRAAWSPVSHGREHTAPATTALSARERDHDLQRACRQRARLRAYDFDADLSLAAGWRDLLSPVALHATCFRDPGQCTVAPKDPADYFSVIGSTVATTAVAPSSHARSHR